MTVDLNCCIRKKKKRFTHREFFRLTIGLVIVLATLLSSCAPAATNTPETAPETSVPPTSVPPTSVPPTSVPPTEVPTEPKVLKIRLYGDIQNLDPAFYKSANDKVVGTNVYSGLVTYAPNSYDIKNDLAESIETSEDGTQITFKLREGVQWQNGYGEVTTEV